MTDTADSKEPVAGLSAASSCIRISLPPEEHLPPSSVTPLSPLNLPSSLSAPPVSTTTRQLLAFRPVYTHQCFPDECLPGWRPLVDAEDESRRVYHCWKNNVTDASKCPKDEEINELHSSFQHCTCNPDLASNSGGKSARIDVHVLLSNGCQKCQVEIQTENITFLDGPASKRLKITTLTEEQQNAINTAQNSIKDNDSNNQNKQKQQQLQYQPMDIQDIVQKISTAIPPIEVVRVNGTTQVDFLLKHSNEKPNNVANFPNSDENKTDAVSNDSLTHPIGRILKTYQRKVKQQHLVPNTTPATHDLDASKFIITVAQGSNPKVAAYHNTFQPLARWFIETADDVDISDEDGGGFWNVLYLFREHLPGNTTSSVIQTVDYASSQQQECQPPSKQHYSLAGYTTLFHFHSPFRKPAPGIIVRVCQALIFPPYQRAGHGAEMLRAVHQYAEEYAKAYAEGTDIVEVNVEDPAPGYIALRDFVDYQRFLNLISTSESKETGGDTYGSPKSAFCHEYLNEYPLTSKEYFATILESKLQTVASLLKITKGQSQIVHELYKLAQLEQWKQNMSHNANIGDNANITQEVETNYRLMVKKSLRTNRKEELGACKGGKEEQKALLGKWFDETLCHYRSLLRLNGK